MKRVTLFEYARNTILSTTILSLGVVPVAASTGRTLAVSTSDVIIPILSDTYGGAFSGDIIRIDCDEREEESGREESDGLDDAAQGPEDGGEVDEGPGQGDEGNGDGQGDDGAGQDDGGTGQDDDGGQDGGGEAQVDVISLNFDDDRTVIRKAFRPVAQDAVQLVGCDDDRRSAQFGKNAAATTIRLLKDTEDYCRFIHKVYLIDCIAAKYERIARRLPNEGENAEVREAFSTAAAKLRSIVRQTKDETVKPSRPRVETKRAPRRLTAIKPERQKAAVATAAKVIDELETRLLRSAENSERRKVYFTQVAQAVDSNKVLLRS